MFDNATAYVNSMTLPLMLDIKTETISVPNDASVNDAPADKKVSKNGGKNGDKKSCKNVKTIKNVTISKHVPGVENNVSEDKTSRVTVSTKCYIRCD